MTKWEIGFWCLLLCFFFFSIQPFLFFFFPQRGTFIFPAEFSRNLNLLWVLSSNVSCRRYESQTWSDLSCEDKCCSFEICQKTESILRCTSGQLGCCVCAHCCIHYRCQVSEHHQLVCAVFFLHKLNSWSCLVPFVMQIKGVSEHTGPHTKANTLTDETWRVGMETN